MISEKVPTVSEFYADQAILLTGATGYLGKAVLEKILRSCPKVKVIYLLMRPKKGQDVEKRLESTLSDSLFDIVRSKGFHKIVPIEGILTEEGLGLSQKDQTDLSQVSIIVHNAADVRFDSPIEEATDANVIGAYNIIEWASKLKNLKSFIYVSSAFVNIDKEEGPKEAIEERFYQRYREETISKVISLLKKRDNCELYKVLSTLDEGNNYTLTKHVAEQILKRYMHQLAGVGIVRASVIIGAWKEPEPGWTNGIFGANSWTMALGSGALKVFLVKKEVILDIIPVDIVANCVIAAGWSVGIKKADKIEIFHCCSSTINPITYGDLFTLTEDMNKHPYSKRIGNPNNVIAVRNNFSYWILDFFLHYLPIAAFHFFQVITKGSSKMIKIYEKLYKIQSSFVHVTLFEWKFKTDNFQKLHNQMSLEDRSDFNLDLTNFRFPEYKENHWLGVRKYLLKDQGIEKIKGSKNKET